MNKLKDKSLCVLHPEYHSYDDDDDRLHQRRKLEDDLGVAEDRMDSHVKIHQNELHGALVTFSQVDARITSELLKILELQK